MKRNIILVLGTFLGFTAIYAQNNCSAFYPMEEGASYEYVHYSKKDKVEGTTAYEVTEVNTSGDETFASMLLKYEDSKGKNAFETDYKITCTGDGVKIDFESMFPSQMQQQYKDMNVEMDMTGTDIQIPNELSVGQALDDANVTVSIDMGAMKMKVNVETTDRTVAAQESVTTAAGTYDCYLITEKTKSKVMMSNTEMSNKLWLAKGVGVVKQESYNKNGKLMSRMELSKFSK